MKDTLAQASVDQIVQGIIKKNIFGAVFYISSKDTNIDLISASGNIAPEDPYYIASINKLFISSIILSLYARGQIHIEDKISDYLAKEFIRELHIYNGQEYSSELTIGHLLSHTSGLPCYLTDQLADGRKVMIELEAGVDQSWPIEKVIQTVKSMKPHFPPRKEGKAKYSDTNYQILNLIIEGVTGLPVQIVLRDLFEELNLEQTYVFDNPEDDNFIPLYYKSKQIKLPLFLSSTQNDIISTVRDQMTFLKAFFSGHFFPKERFHELEKWNNVFFPFKYGIGIQKFSMPRILSPFQPVPEMVGHSGSVGSVAFYVPELELYITGTTNQQAQPNIAFQTMIKILLEFRKK